METYVIVEMTPGETQFENRYIARIVRSYESKTRAEDDLNLLQEVEEGGRDFKIITVPYIDR